MMKQRRKKKTDNPKHISGSDAQVSSQTRPAEPGDHLGRSFPSTTHLDGNQDSLSVTNIVQGDVSQRHSDFPPTFSSSSKFVHKSGDSRKNLMKGGGWNSFKLALSVIMESTSAFPPLQSAVGGLVKVLDTIQQASDNEDQFTSMTERLIALSTVLKKFEGREDDQAVGDRVDALTKSIERQVVFIEVRMKRGNLRRVLDASKDAGDIVNSLRELTFAVQLFEIDTVMSTEVLGKKLSSLVNDLREREILKVLNAAEGAAYSETGRTGCLDGTRVDTLSKILDWASDSRSPSVYWLNGMAGTGKSAIALSICKLLDTQGRLGGSFFCSRQAESLNKIRRILPTVSFQLCCISEVYRREVVQVLEHTSRRSYSAASLQEQMKDLFIEPSRKLPPFNGGAPIIVIDALDECSFESTVIDFLRVTLRSDLPFKFLISSRPETHIVDALSSQRKFESDAILNHFPDFRRDLVEYASLKLHDIETDIVEDDINRYLKWKLGYVFDLKDNPSIQNDIDALAKKSGKLFIYAFTAVQYITVGANLSLPSKALRLRLKRLIQSPVEPTCHQTETIDKLYQEIFMSAYSRKEQEEIIYLRSALDTVLCILEPQSVSSIAMLLGEDPGDIQRSLGNFQSVLAVSESYSIPILTFHASFPEFVRDKSRSKNYMLNEKSEHQRLALLCLQLMNCHLREDICNLRIRQAHIREIDPSVVEEHIPHGLQYACYFWASHLSMIDYEYAYGDDTIPITQELERFIKHHLLHWLECLNITKNLHRALNCLQNARMLLMRLPMVDSIIQLRTILVEAELMIPQCFQFARIHTLKIYSSALVWPPRRAKLYQQFMPNDNIPCLLHGIKEDWEVCEQSLQMDGEVYSVSFSPDGSKLASGSSDKMVRIWNLESGEELKKLEGHSDMVQSVSFTPDGLRLASGSSDKTVRIWCLVSGEELKKLEGHSDRVQSVSFIPNGSKLASGSWDKTVRIWNVESGEELKRLEGHSCLVQSVSFSPDGSKLASGSWDNTVRIWDVESGEELKKLEGHSEWVQSVSFSSDGSKIASGSSDKTVRIWNVESGEELKKLGGHSQWVQSVSFSPDGSKLASGSSDKTVRIWNVESGSEVKKLKGHSHWVQSVSFSPDGSNIASGSDDKFVKVWNVDSGKELIKLGRHLDRVQSISFSPSDVQG